MLDPAFGAIYPCSAGLQWAEGAIAGKVGSRHRSEAQGAGNERPVYLNPWPHATPSTRSAAARRAPTSHAPRPVMPVRPLRTNMPVSAEHDQGDRVEVGHDASRALRGVQVQLVHLVEHRPARVCLDDDVAGRQVDRVRSGLCRTAAGFRDRGGRRCAARSPVSAGCRAIATISARSVAVIGAMRRYGLLDAVVGIPVAHVVDGKP